MADDPLANAEKGEGNYRATRDYNRRTERFLDEHGNEVEDLARQAEQALDGEEGDELRRAEEQGKEPAHK